MTVRIFEGTVGCTVREVGCAVREAGCAVREAGCAVREAGCTVRDLGCTVRDLGCTVREAGCAVRDLGCAVRFGGSVGVMRVFSRLLRAHAATCCHMTTFSLVNPPCASPNGLHHLRPYQGVQVSQ